MTEKFISKVLSLHSKVMQLFSRCYVLLSDLIILIFLTSKSFSEHLLCRVILNFQMTFFSHEVELLLSFWLKLGTLRQALGAISRYVQTCVGWVLVITLNIPKIQLWDQDQTSVFTYQKLISLKVMLHILFAIKGFCPKHLEPMMSEAHYYIRCPGTVSIKQKQIQCSRGCLPCSFERAYHGLIRSW